MELQIQPDFIEVKSPIDRFREQWTQQPGAISLLRQRSVVLQHPELVQYAEFGGIKGWTQPLLFGLLGLVLMAFVISASSWWLSHDRGRQADEIVAVRADLQSEARTNQGVIDAAQFELARIKSSRKEDGFTVGSAKNLTRADAIAQLDNLMEETRKSQEAYQRRAEIKIQNLRAKQDGLALAAAGTPVILSLALLFAAPLFRKQIQKQYARCTLTRRADNFYLYSIVSHGLLLNCLVMVLLNLFLGRSAYGLGGIFETIGPIGQGVAWLALYALMLYWFFIASKALHKTMQIPRPLTWYGPENKTLLYIHNSFWTVFAPLEAGLLLLAYAVYFFEKA